MRFYKKGIKENFLKILTKRYDLIILPPHQSYLSSCWFSQSIFAKYICKTLSIHLSGNNSERVHYLFIIIEGEFLINWPISMLTD